MNKLIVKKSKPAIDFEMPVNTSQKCGVAVLTKPRSVHSKV